MVKTRQWVLAQKPTDFPILEDDNATFKLEDAETGELKDGQVLVKTLYFVCTTANTLAAVL
jgi:NADPH-dependent curcumin reductase CurA